jgi:hypothetical protein
MWSPKESRTLPQEHLVATNERGRKGREAEMVEKGKAVGVVIELLPFMMLGEKGCIRQGTSRVKLWKGHW